MKFSSALAVNVALAEHLQLQHNEVNARGGKGSTGYIIPVLGTIQAISRAEIIQGNSIASLGASA